MTIKMLNCFQIPKKRALPAYTLLELLIAFTILITISVMIAVPVVSGLGAKKLNTQVVESMTDVIKAYSSYLRNKGPIQLGVTKAVDILDYLNYQSIDKLTVITVPNGNGLADAGATTTNLQNSTCSDTTPCLMTHTGGLLQVNANAVFPVIPGGKLFSGIVMNFDPDGAGPQAATTIVFYNTGRITSAPFVDNSVEIDSTASPDATITAAPFGNQYSDPEYMFAFTNDTVN